MKIFKRKCIRGTNWALAGLMSLLGFSGCDGIINDDEGGMVEYGSPYAKYEFKGKVTDAANNPIQGIKVEVEGDWSTTKNNFHPFYGLDDITTTADGTFKVNATESTYALVKFRATDVDGEANGLYKKDSVIVTLKKDDFKDGERWFNGHVSKEVTIRLNKEEEK